MNNRIGNKWTVNEVLSLHREYELLGWSLDQIAKKHRRTALAIMYKLDHEGLADFNNLYNNYHNLNRDMSSNSLNDGEDEDEDDGEDDEDYVDECEEDDGEDDEDYVDDCEEDDGEDDEDYVDECEEDHDESLTSRVDKLESDLSEIKDMLKVLTSQMSSLKPKKYQLWL
jgi:hypothetical protein